MGNAKIDEKVLHNAFLKAFGDDDNLKIRRNFSYTDETGTVREMDHIIIDKQRKILVVFSDKSFKNHLIGKASEKYKDSVDQNLDFIDGIKIHPKIRIGSGKQAECIKLNDISSWYCVIQFNVIYPVFEDNNIRYINCMDNVKFNTVLSDTSKKDYRQLTIGYHSLLRILEYCCKNNIEFVKFTQILSSIYDANEEQLDFGISIQSAFECIYEDKKYNNKRIAHLVLADVNQSRIQIIKYKHKFYSNEPYIINIGCSLDNIAYNMKNEVGLKVLSDKRYAQLFNNLLDRIIDIHMDNSQSSYKLRKSANYLSGKHCLGVIVMGYKVYRLEDADIAHIIERIQEGICK